MAALGLTMPLLAVGALRVPVGGDGVPLIVCLLLGVACLDGLRRAFGIESIARDLGLDTLFLIIAMIAFWTWHLFAAMRSIEFGSALLEHFRLTIGMVCFATLLGSKRMLAGGMGSFWGVSILVSAILLSALMYRYLIVFGMPYLGNDWNMPTRLGKNQLGWFLAVTMPFVLIRFAYADRGWRIFIPTIIHILAWMYVASRGSWACGTIGTLLALGFARGSKLARRALSRLVMLALLLSCVVLLALSVSDLTIRPADLDIVTRLVASDSLSPAQHSNKLRMELLRYYAELFRQSPLIGIGLRNSLHGGGYVSHNDVLAILAEQGLVGIATFLAIIAFVVRSVFAQPRVNWCSLASRGAVVSLVAYLLLINAYASPMFWILLALVMLSSSEGSGTELWMLAGANCGDDQTGHEA